jgi:hypothetical protein
MVHGKRALPPACGSAAAAAMAIAGEYLFAQAAEVGTVLAL